MKILKNSNHEGCIRHDPASSEKERINRCCTGEPPARPYARRLWRVARRHSIAPMKVSDPRLSDFPTIRLLNHRIQRDHDQDRQRCPIEQLLAEAVA